MTAQVQTLSELDQIADPKVAALLADPPKLHRTHLQEPWSYSVSPRVGAILDRHVTPGACTLETGAGISTLIFALKGAKHISVVPDQGLADRIYEYCLRQGIPTNGLSFEVTRSEDILPRLALPELAFVLIDGSHAFPIPFIDWFYAGRKVRDGGVLLVDDIQLLSGSILRDFLLGEPNWTMLYDLSPRSVAFLREGEPYPGDWTAQLYLLLHGALDLIVPLKKALRAVRHTVPEETTLLLLDSEGLLRGPQSVFGRRQVIRLSDSPEADGALPAEAATALRELEAARSNGATHLVVLWSAFDWFDSAVAFRRHVESTGVRLLADETVVIYSLPWSGEVSEADGG